MSDRWGARWGARRWLSSLLLSGAVAAHGAAQVPARANAQLVARLSGVVHDSIVRAPLAGAFVQLVAIDSVDNYGRTERSDSLGRFAFTQLRAGRYVLGFFHPMLDSLGLEPIMRTVSIDDARDLHVDLAIPSATQMRATICGETSSAAAGGSGGGVVIGIVRDARSGAPVRAVTVAGQWTEFSLGARGVTRRQPRRVTTTHENGWFAVCGAPSPGSLTLVASRGKDSTDLLELEVPAEGFLRRELHLGSARTVSITDSGVVAAGAPAPRREPTTRSAHAGDGRLSGTVFGATSGRPLSGVQVGIVNGPQTRTNQRGEWMLGDVPTGTRALDVRAVGYYPQRLSVDVVDGAPTVRVALSTLASVLATMQVKGNANRFRNLAGFRERMRAATGRYLTSDDIARRQPLVTSDLFRAIPGVYFEDRGDSEAEILMRSTGDHRCVPAVYLNGQQMTGLRAHEIDAMVRPQELAGIEIYQAGTAPAEFQPGMQFLSSLSGCGSIVLWTK